ncbi:hypothetical protein LUZ60_010554 [Juncus effusus]|nr:hypothetical protein LUZ60_010554 [Juncus effusus]
MAPALLASKFLHLPSSHSRKISRRSWCAARSEKGSGDTSSVVKIAVEGATEILRLFSPMKSRDFMESKIEGSSVNSVDDVVAVLKADYKQAYFLTGDFTFGIYSEDCLFEDPTIKFRGRERYAQNLDLLVPFFENPSLELEQIEKGFDYGTSFILASWKLRTNLKFPWRPLIHIRGKTTYDVDNDFKIVRHSESWSISAIEAIAQIFAFNSRD